MGVGFFGIMQGRGCWTSLDSVLSPNAYPVSQRSKGLLLHSAATAHSTMDYSTMAIDEGVVDSPITHSGIPVRSDTPSPVWPCHVAASPTPVRRDCNLTKRSLYCGSVNPTSANSFKVGFDPFLYTFVLYFWL